MAQLCGNQTACDTCFLARYAANRPCSDEEIGLDCADCAYNSRGVVDYFVFHYCTLRALPVLSCVLLVAWLLLVLSLLGSTDCPTKAS